MHLLVAWLRLAVVLTREKVLGFPGWHVVTLDDFHYTLYFHHFHSTFLLHMSLFLRPSHL